jgi:hypothetical protein
VLLFMVFKGNRSLLQDFEEAKGINTTSLLNTPKWLDRANGEFQNNAIIAVPDLQLLFSPKFLHFHR